MRAMPIRQRGVTLVELLVGLSIFSLVAGIVILTAPPRRPPARDAADLFAMRLAASVDNVIFAGASVRLEWTGTGYRFAREVGEEWVTDAQWKPASTGVAFSLTREGGVDDNETALNGRAATGVLIGLDGAGYGRSRREPPPGARTGDRAENSRRTDPREGGDGSTSAREIFPIDPLGFGETLTAQFASETVAWRVTMSPAGEIKVTRQ